MLGIAGMTVLGVVLTARSGDLRWLFLGLPLTLVLLLVARFAPIGYRLTGEGLRIERKAGPRIIAYRRIRGVDAEARPMSGFTVTGSKGVFGRFGLFWNRGVRRAAQEPPRYTRPERRRRMIRVARPPEGRAWPSRR
ncbi:MAG TPA: hypothetical protein VET45_15720 [Candidatus Binatia bacterium]|nr:hypothetical protein [Candidatus Binatia bacterium]